MKNLFPFFLLVLFFSCDLDIPDENIVTSLESSPMEDLSVPDFFTYKTSKTLHLTVSAEGTNRDKLKKVPFQIEYSIGGEWKKSMEGTTGQSGSAELAINLPDAAEELKVTTSFLGLPSEKIINLGGTEYLGIVLGDENQEGFAGDENGQQFLQKGEEKKPQKPAEPSGRFADQFTYMGTYSSSGKPDYLETPNDVVSQEFYDLINSSLPESQPVPTYHPEYLEDDLVTTVNLIEEGEVWVTFVHEGAGYRNSLGYYVYPTDTPPNSMEEIDELRIIFPNVSFQGSGGSLVTGNKVYLGTFPAGMSVAWFLVPDGWNSSTQEVEFNEDEDIKFSDEALNDFTQPEYRQHIALLYDQSLETLILGMEDINRPGGDNDFNDAVFYVTVSPFSAVQTSALAAADNTNDDDEDGISNSVDVAPNDPNIAFQAFTPAQGTFGTLAFEDLFPSQGDYDMNDLVVDYNFKEYLSPENEIVKMDISLTLRAAGGVHHSGIGFELGVLPNQVASVSGYQFSGGNISLAENGTEEGQDKAVVLAFNDCLTLLGGGSLINTELGKATVDAVELELTVVFTQAISRAELGTAPFNPFLFNKDVRGKEVHLPGYPPTSLVITDYFGSADDVTDPSNGVFYKTANNLPFAIDIPVSFDYLIERSPINQGHLKFTQWAESGGSAFSDWYMEGGDYRAMDKIY